MRKSVLQFSVCIASATLLSTVPLISAVFADDSSKVSLKPPKVEQTAATIAISDERGTILVYNKRSPSVPDNVEPVYQRSGFLHPIATPTGRIVTAVFPIDHKHQDGVFSAWVRTRWQDRDIDFWNIAGGTGRVLHEKVVSTFSDRSKAGFEVDLIHRAMIEPTVDVLRERWKITAYPTDDTFRCFDMDTTQIALTDSPLLVREYHYGGIALRGLTRWVQPKNRSQAPLGEKIEDSDFLNDHGSERIAGNHQKSRWVCLHGKIDGNPVSITVLCHPENFRAPQSARLHPSKPYFCFAPCVDGDFVIDREHPFTSKYRFLVTDAAPDPEWLSMQWQLWADGLH